MFSIKTRLVNSHWILHESLSLFETLRSTVDSLNSEFICGSYPIIHNVDHPLGVFYGIIYVHWYALCYRKIPLFIRILMVYKAHSCKLFTPQMLPIEIERANTLFIRIYSGIYYLFYLFFYRCIRNTYVYKL